MQKTKVSIEISSNLQLIVSENETISCKIIFPVIHKPYMNNYWDNNIFYVNILFQYHFNILYKFNKYLVRSFFVKISGIKITIADRLKKYKNDFWKSYKKYDNKYNSKI